MRLGSHIAVAVVQAAAVALIRFDPSLETSICIGCGPKKKKRKRKKERALQLGDRRFLITVG